MADNGKLYPAFDMDFPAAMASVCAKADVILPNITEGCLLTGMPTAPSMTVLTSLNSFSVSLDWDAGQPFSLGSAMSRTGLESQASIRTEMLSHTLQKNVPRAITGPETILLHCLWRLMRGLSLGDALSLAADYVVECIEAIPAPVKPDGTVQSSSPRSPGCAGNWKKDWARASPDFGSSPLQKDSALANVQATYV